MSSAGMIFRNLTLLLLPGPLACTEVDGVSPQREKEAEEQGTRLLKVGRSAATKQRNREKIQEPICVEYSELSMSDIMREFEIAHNSFTPLPTWLWPMTGQFSTPIQATPSMHIAGVPGTQWLTPSSPLSSWPNTYAQGFSPNVSRSCG